MAVKTAKSNKTEAVMRLLTGKKTVANPVLNNNPKENEIEQEKEIPVQSSVPESTPAVQETVPAEVKTEPVQEEIPAVQQIPSLNGTVMDITGELVTELLPNVLERFNCCQCVMCYAEAMSTALERVPPLKIKINGKEDVERAEKMKQQGQGDVMSTLIRLAIERRRLPKHEE